MFLDDFKAAGLDRHAASYRDRDVDVRVLAIESDPELHRRLKVHLADYTFANARCGKFITFVPYIAEVAQTATVFLYLDPYTVNGLDWSAVESVLIAVKQNNSSVELLLNFNSPSFVRRALAAMKLNVPAVNVENEDDEQIEVDDATPPSIEVLNSIAGGDWWHALVQADTDFKFKVSSVVTGFRSKVLQVLGEAGSLAIYARPSHTIPKYYLIFGTRHEDGLQLMNDAMAKTRGDSLFHIDLFAEQGLKELILTGTAEWIARRELILHVKRTAFCSFTRSEIRGGIEDLLRAHELKSETGKIRINDQVRVRRA